jgi:copper chaperone CopZ
VSVSIKKMEGVDSVQVSLNEGLARIQLKPGNKLRLAQLRERVADNGFTPKEARVAVLGEIISTNGRLQLKVTRADEIFDLFFAPKAPQTEDELKKHVGKTLLVEGVVAPPKGKKASQNLEVARFKDRREPEGKKQ